MVKIKTKKKLTLPELIQWGWDNKIVNKRFYGNFGGPVLFDEDSWIGIDEGDLVQTDETFEVEVEEEITEETKIPVLVRMTGTKESDDNFGLDYYYGLSIMDATSNIIESKAFYMLNDDMTMTLIWRNGEMVE